MAFTLRHAVALLILGLATVAVSTVSAGDLAPVADDSPVSDVDKDLIVRVRTANLWESPTGQQAQQRTTNEVIKRVGRQLASDHVLLDEIIRRIAMKHNIVLPSMPTEEQLTFMQTLSGLSGDAYDQKFVEFLRKAHGKVFNLLGQVRAATQNTEIRQFAVAGIKVVNRHMTLLESTGKVDFSGLPTAPGIK